MSTSKYSFFASYDALVKFIRQYKLPQDPHALQNALASHRFPQLPEEAKFAGKLLTEEDWNPEAVLLSGNEALTEYRRLFQMNFPPDYRFRPEQEAFIRDSFAEKEFTPVVAPIGSSPVYQGIFRYRLGEKYLLFPFYQDCLSPSYQLFMKILRKFLERKLLPAEDYIYFVHLYEKAAFRSGQDRGIVLKEVETFWRRAVESSPDSESKKLYWLQLLIFCFRTEIDETGYLYWAEKDFRATQAVWQELFNWQQQTQISYTHLERLILGWIQFVLYRAAGDQEKAEKLAVRLLEEKETLRFVGEEKLYRRVPVIPVDQPAHILVVRPLVFDFQDILVSYLLGQLVDREDYAGAKELLEKQDRFFAGFLQRYKNLQVRSADEKGLEEAQTDYLKQELEKMQHVLGSQGLQGQIKNHPYQVSTTPDFQNELLQWAGKYIFNSMSVFHDAGEEKLGRFLNKIYLRLLLPE